MHDEYVILGDICDMIILLMTKRKKQRDFRHVYAHASFQRVQRNLPEATVTSATQEDTQFGCCSICLESFSFGQKQKVTLLHERFSPTNDVRMLPSGIITDVLSMGKIVA